MAKAPDELLKSVHVAPLWQIAERCAQQLQEQEQQEQEAAALKAARKKAGKKARRAARGGDQAAEGVRTSHVLCPSSCVAWSDDR